MPTIETECVCGGSTANPNPDCERCQLVAEVARLKDEQSVLFEGVEVALTRLDALAIRVDESLWPFVVEAASQLEAVLRAVGWEPKSEAPHVHR